MPADFYDVNVHPTKMGVRFKDEDKIYKVLYHAIKSTMLKFEFLGNNENEEHNEEYIQNELDFLTNEYDILDEMLTNERTSIKDVEKRFIATVACKAAVKANMDLSKPEVENLIQSLLSLNNPYTCPHGRPTTIKISKEYLEEHL